VYFLIVPLNKRYLKKGLSWEIRNLVSFYVSSDHIWKLQEVRSFENEFLFFLGLRSRD